MPKKVTTVIFSAISKIESKLLKIGNHRNLHWFEKELKIA